jgi:metallo-beta-lactamase family protein
MAGSGMSNGGRILHHEKRYLSDPKNTLFLIGYQAAGSLGRQLLDGAKVVNILGDNVSVAARVVSLSGYSAHKDSDHLLDFVKGAEETLEMVYCIHGEPKSSFALVQKIRDYLGIKAEAPAKNDVVTIEL